MEEIYRRANDKFWELYKKVKSGNYTPSDVRKKDIIVIFANVWKRCIAYWNICLTGTELNLFIFK